MLSVKIFIDKYHWQTFNVMRVPWSLPTSIYCAAVHGATLDLIQR